MNNAEVFKEYGTEQWVIEENLSYLLMNFREKCIEEIRNHPTLDPEGCIKAVNTVSVVKEFMKEETLCNVKFAEKSKIDTLENMIEIEEGDFREI